MATCDILDLCIEVTTDNEDNDRIYIRETDLALRSGPDVWVKTSREDWGDFLRRVKSGSFDNV